MMLPVIGDCCAILYDTPRPSHQRQILTVKSASEQFPTVKIVMSWIRRLVLENIGANLQLLYNCVLYTYTVTPKTELDCEISLRAVSHVKITMGWIPRLVSDNVGANRRLLYDCVQYTYTVTPKTDFDCEISLIAVSHCKNRHELNSTAGFRQCWR